MFGDPSVIAKNQAAQAEAAYRSGMLANAQRELDMKTPLIEAQRQQALASAGYDATRTKRENQEIDAANALRDIFTSGLTQDPATGQATFNIGQAGVALGQALASDPTGQRAKSLGEAIGKLQATLINQNPNATEDQRRQAAALLGQMPNNATAFTVEQADRLAEQERGTKVAVQQQANMGRLMEPLVVPGGSSVLPSPITGYYDLPPVGSMLGTTSSTQTPSSLGEAVAPQATQPGIPSVVTSPTDVAAPMAPYRSGSTIVVPKQDANDSLYTPAKQAAFTKEFSETGAQALAALDAIKPMIDDPRLLEMSVNPVGGIPVASQMFRWMQGATNDPKLNAHLQFTEATIRDWLNKSKDLKGAITEYESAQLRASQPPENASAGQKRAWLEALYWTLQKQAAYANDQQAAVQKGLPLPLPSQWSAEYQARNPRPNILTPRSTESAAPAPTSTPSVASALAPGATVRVISPDGQRGSIPASQLQEALQAGFRQE